MSKRKSKVISVLIACMLILSQANNWGYNPLDIHVSAASTSSLTNVLKALGYVEIKSDKIIDRYLLPITTYYGSDVTVGSSCTTSCKTIFNASGSSGGYNL